jgi:hypothetical protein
MRSASTHARYCACSCDRRTDEIDKISKPVDFHFVPGRKPLILIRVWEKRVWWSKWHNRVSLPLYLLVSLNNDHCFGHRQIPCVSSVGYNQVVEIGEELAVAGPTVNFKRQSIAVQMGIQRYFD